MKDMDFKKKIESEIEEIEVRLEYLAILYDNLENQLKIINQQVEVNTQERADLGDYRQYLMERLDILDEE